VAGWYVWRDDPSRPFEPIREQPEQAQQLRVRDLEDPRVWEALSEPDTQHPERNHTQLIQQYEARYRGRDAVVIILPAWVVPEGHVIIDGAHRACALYRVSPPNLDADVIGLTAPPGWPDVQAAPRRTVIAP